GQQFRGRKSLLYADTRLMTHIDVQTDDLFKTKNIYADSRAEKVGDTVIIHYNPDDPTQYYFGNRVDEIRDTGVFCYAMAGAMFVLNLLFLRWIIFLYHSSKNKNTETTELTE
ncbi:MAG: hypothetical protein IIU00_00255, partial [Clostridia bacterium]|nr:hypothetical protein [Clostridia bacterium]